MGNTLRLRLADKNGNEVTKILEEITTDAEELKVEFQFEKIGTDLLMCLSEAMSHYNDITYFISDVNYYRKYIPNPKFAATHPLKVKFYK